MKVMSLAELQPHEVVQAPAPTMTKKEKLTRFADLVAGCGTNLGLFHNLEFCNMADKNSMAATGSAFGVAASDPTFAAAGCGSSVGDAQRFFELSNEELHEFSCDCGGAISNKDQARRIRNIAEQAS